VIDNIGAMNTNQITHAIRNRIAAGEWAVGDQIDTFDIFMARYGIPTVYRMRQVLRPLIDEGVIESQHGSGSFLRRLPAPDPDIHQTPVQAARDLLNQAVVEINTLRRQIDMALARLTEA
jgi:DNA-binding GntR family transcriptional regulator